ncbi:MAG: hypothetical protein FJZ01_20235 [Candidatus Sericytochromatia bacterium]|nr:hypothetical protein [Candidatus Tanganyikabacteria bacterium]
MSVVESSQLTVVFFGAVWLLLIIARPGLALGGPVWAKYSGRVRRPSPWVWIVFLGACFLVAGQLLPGGLGVHLTEAGYAVWVVLFGKDIFDLIARSKLKRDGSEDQSSTRLSLSFGDRLVSLLILSMVAAVLVSPLWIPGLGPDATIECLAIGLQLLFVLRIGLNMEFEAKRIGFRARWVSLGTVAFLLVLVASAVWAAASMASLSDANVIFAGLFVSATALISVGRVGKEDSGALAHPGFEELNPGA